MEQNEKVDELYKLGFEHGYWLTKSKSIEYDGILKRNSHKQQYAKGMFAGKREAVREQSRERIADINRQHDIHRDKEQERE